MDCNDCVGGINIDDGIHNDVRNGDDGVHDGIRDRDDGIHDNIRNGDIHDTMVGAIVHMDSIGSQGSDIAAFPHLFLLVNILYEIKINLEFVSLKKLETFKHKSI